MPRGRRSCRRPVSVRRRRPGGGRRARAGDRPLRPAAAARSRRAPGGAVGCRGGGRPGRVRPPGARRVRPDALGLRLRLPSASPTGATGPLTTANLLRPAAFAPDVGVGRIHVTDRYGDGHYANAACTGEKTLEETLGGPGAHFRGLMTSRRTNPSDPTLALDGADQVAREVAAEARSASLAQNFAQRLLLEQVPCQEETPGHWVYGRTVTVRLAPDVTANWMGAYPGSLNTTGTAPEGKEPCGGVAVLRSGTHYGCWRSTPAWGRPRWTASSGPLCHSCETAGQSSNFPSPGGITPVVRGRSRRPDQQGEKMTENQNVQPKSVRRNRVAAAPASPPR
ncbi:hypothetical protein O1L60_19335 [Streptomyces diastatochromogenes]|nr:hypothetical protein [Streptomyces diastatochromogenes]